MICGHQSKNHLSAQEIELPVFAYGLSVKWLPFWILPSIHRSSKQDSEVTYKLMAENVVQGISQYGGCLYYSEFSDYCFYSHLSLSIENTYKIKYKKLALYPKTSFLRGPSVLSD